MGERHAEFDGSFERGLVDRVGRVGVLMRARREPEVVEATDRNRRQAGGTGGQRRRGAPATVSSGS